MESKPIYQKSIQFKKLYLFSLASFALMLAGTMLSDSYDLKQAFLLLYINITGVFLVYRLNDCIDQDVDLQLNLKNFFSHKLHKLVVAQLFLLVVPLSLWLLNTFTFVVLAIMALVGALYSITFNLGSSKVRIKHVFFVKNLVIGAGWGALVLVGSGQINDPFITSLFVFVTIQVIIGSGIRDIPDLEKDRISKVQSFPVVMGIQPTVMILMGLNIVSICAAFYVDWNPHWLIGFSAVIIWRMINLSALFRYPNNAFWSQTFNLLTCVVILLMVATIRYINLDGYYF